MSAIVNFCALPDDELFILIEAQPDRSQPHYRRLESVMLRRAEGGNLSCQRHCFRLLESGLLRQGLTIAQFLERAEPFARKAAESGELSDKLVLSGFLFTKYAWLNDAGLPDLAVDAIAEGLTILGRLINEGGDFLLEPYLVVRGEAPEDARLAADAELMMDGLMAELSEEPEVARAKRRRRGETIGERG